jgi:colicin import membrane protein
VVRDSHNVIPVSLALLLHVVIFGSMIIAFDYARPTPFTPLAIKATLVQDVPETPPPAPVVEPEPEPVIEEPEPEPDNSEELRRQAEEEKRRLDALLERQRLEELKRKEQEARERKEREEAERKKREEEELERKRQEAERKRQEDIQRQREENERRRREEEEARQAEMEAEERRFAARSSAEMAAYQFAIAQKIRRNWAVPASAGPETRCTVRVTQLPGGEVVSVNIISCNGDAAVQRSVEAAIRRSSPLPEPSNPDLFDRNLTLNLTLEREN